jgi:hypothetical protein
VIVVVVFDFPVTVTVRLWALVGELEFVVDGEPVAELLSVCRRVPVSVGEIRAVPVRRVERVFDTETVEVLEFEELFVLVRVLTIVRLPNGLVVVVLDAFMVAVPLGVAVCVFDDASVLEWVDEPVVVLDDVTDPVDVLVLRIVFVCLADLEYEGDAEDVFEDALVSVPEGVAVGVLDRGPERLRVGELDDVFDWEGEPVVVRVAVTVFVAVLVPVVVFVPWRVTVCLGEELPVFDEEAVFVDVIVAVIVRVDVGDGVTRDVGKDERDKVVVFVDVFDIVDVDVGTMPRANSLGICKADSWVAEHAGGSPLIPRRAVKRSRALISVILYNFP